MNVHFWLAAGLKGALAQRHRGKSATHIRVDWAYTFVYMVYVSMYEIQPGKMQTFNHAYIYIVCVCIYIYIYIYITYTLPSSSPPPHTAESLPEDT
jgi:hypothetical protein